MKYDAMRELYKHRKKYGTAYKLPSGEIVRMKDKQAIAYMRAHNLQISVYHYEK